MSGPGVIVRPLTAIQRPGSAAIAADSVFFSGSQNLALTPQTITPSGGTAPYSFASADLPTGVTVGAASGTISGTPTGSGNTTSHVTITDSIGTTRIIPVFFTILQTSFSENFAAEAARNGLGKNWLAYYTSVPTTTAYQRPIVNIGNPASALNIISGGNSGAPTSWLGMVWTPVPVYLNLFDTLQQYVQTNVLQLSAMTVMLCVYYNSENTGNEFPQYYGLLLTTTANARIYRTTNGTVNTQLLDTGVAPNANDTWKLSVDNQGGQNVLTAYQNGVQVGQVTDNNAARLTKGAPGFRWQDSTVALNTTTSFNNFSCGIGV